MIMRTPRQSEWHPFIDAKLRGLDRDPKQWSAWVPDRPSVGAAAIRGKYRCNDLKNVGGNIVVPSKRLLVVCTLDIFLKPMKDHVRTFLIKWKKRKHQGAPAWILLHIFGISNPSGEGGQYQRKLVPPERKKTLSVGGASILLSAREKKHPVKRIWKKRPHWTIGNTGF